MTVGYERADIAKFGFWSALVALAGVSVFVGWCFPLVGAENSVTSRDLHVLVDETAEPVASQRPNNCPGGWWGEVRGRALIKHEAAQSDR